MAATSWLSSVWASAGYPKPQMINRRKGRPARCMRTCTSVDWLYRYLPRFGSCDLKQLTTSLVFFPFMRSQLSVTFGQGTIHAISKKKLSAQRNIALHCDPPSITTQWSWPSDIVQPWCTCPDLGVHGRPRHSKVRHVHIISV